MSARDISNSDDIIDSRDIIKRLEELEQEIQDVQDELDELDAQGLGAGGSGDLSTEYSALRDLLVTLSEDDEYLSLKAFADQASEVSDWHYGETFIRDSYFQDYAEQLADDLGCINSEARWPNDCIDWERAARELQMDYTSYTWDGVTYWARA